MKKLIYILLALLLICVSLPLSSCHGARYTNEFVIPEAFDETREYELVFWAKNDTNKIQTKVYTDAIERFESLYPNIKIKLSLYSDYGRIYKDVITNISTKTTPDVCITYPDHIATYLTGNNPVIALDELFENGRYGLGGSDLRFDSPRFDEIVPQFIGECKIGEHYYALPFMRSTEACYINKTYVEALGYEIPEILTWDFIWEVSEAALSKNSDGTYKINGQKVMIPFIYKSTDNMMIQYLKQAGAPYSDDSGNVLIFSDQTKEFLKTVAEHSYEAFSTFKISSYPGNYFNAGQCIFAIDSTAGATWIGSKATHLDISKENLVEFETVVRMIPQVDPEQPKMISQGPSVCVFAKDDPNRVLAAWMFAQYLITNEVQITYAETEGYVPVTLKAQETDEYKDYLSRSGEDNDFYYSIKIDASKLLLENRQYTFVTPVFNGSASLRDAAGQLIENVVKSVKRKEKIDDAYFEKLYSDVNSLYRLDQIRPGGNTKAALGALPAQSVALIAALCVIWICIAALFIVKEIKKSKKSN
ncbi:MAG: extracellular solute-binding protein [Clostridia bacterium]|nr:extracellular solute-binding protein [Clostridia bacterium]